MKQIIIGTAGHIDHGKTALIRALTGIDTDRLEEEKRRGITIDLGFAWMTLAGGVQAGIIDVPGHERFIKNMLAGAGAIDLVLMAVAADEGVMPQTREHLDILSMLGVKHGIVVLTKCDLADEETLALARDDIVSCFKGTFLERMPIIEVSARTGEGLDTLRAQIERMAVQMPLHPTDRPLWMPIDRVFTMNGFGTVVTGTVLDGRISIGDALCVCPSGETARVRGLQSGGVEIETAVAGQRVAANLTGIKKEALMRGDVLAASQHVSVLLDVKLTMLKSAGRKLAHGTRLHLSIGAQSILCRAALLDADELRAGESAYAQLRLEVPAAARIGDRFVIRFYSPLETIGGGVVLDAHPVKHKRLDSGVLKRLQLYDTGTLSDQLLYEASHVVFTESDLRARFSHVSDAAFLQARDDLCADGSLCAVNGLLLPPAVLHAHKQRVRSLLQAFHTANPLCEGMPVQEVRKVCLDALLDYFVQQNLIKRTSMHVSLPDFSPLQTPLYQALSAKILALYDAAGCMPPDTGSVAQTIESPPETVLRVLELLLSQGALVKVSASMLLFAAAYQAARDAVSQAVAEQGSITLAQLRDMLGISRKYAQAILEHFDEIGFTQKNGDARTLA
ncbi:selenocysteine-specific translation elongation factor [Oscillospiraceae bacterium PP1C4]